MGVIDRIVVGPEGASEETPEHGAGQAVRSVEDVIGAPREAWRPGHGHGLGILEIRRFRRHRDDPGRDGFRRDIVGEGRFAGVGPDIEE
jgi:hypothetical protein